jgi:hypothetical protein
MPGKLLTFLILKKIYWQSSIFMLLLSYFIRKGASLRGQQQSAAALGTVVPFGGVVVTWTQVCGWLDAATLGGGRFPRPRQVWCRLFTLQGNAQGMIELYPQLPSNPEHPSSQPVMALSMTVVSRLVSMSRLPDPPRGTGGGGTGGGGTGTGGRTADTVPGGTAQSVNLSDGRRNSSDPDSATLPPGAPAPASNAISVPAVTEIDWMALEVRSGAAGKRMGGALGAGDLGAGSTLYLRAMVESSAREWFMAIRPYADSVRSEPKVCGLREKKKKKKKNRLTQPPPPPPHHRPAGVQLVGHPRQDADAYQHRSRSGPL